MKLPPIAKTERCEWLTPCKAKPVAYVSLTDQWLCAKHALSVLRQAGLVEPEETS